MDPHPQPEPRTESRTPAEQQPKKSIADLLLLAEFLVDNLAQRAVETTSPAQKKTYAIREQEMKGVLAILRSTEDPTTPLEDMVNILKESHADWQEDTEATEDEQYEKLQELEATILFIETNKNQDIRTRKDVSAWQEEKRTALEQARHAEMEEIKRQDTVRTTDKIHNVREQIAGNEQAKDRETARERAVEIVLQDGAVNIHTSVKNDTVKAASYHGFQTMMTNTQIDLMKHGYYQGYTGSMHTSDRPDIHERISIGSMTKHTREVEQSAQKGFLGFGAKDATYRDRVEPVLHDELYQHGKKERAVYFSYSIPQSRGETEWHDYSGRGGQMLEAKIILPESTARELEQILDQDPLAMRYIIERIMKERILKDPSSWEASQVNKHNDSLCPPYEVWDAQGSEIYIDREGQKPRFYRPKENKTK